jgi:hypothetical protein
MPKVYTSPNILWSQCSGWRKPYLCLRSFSHVPHSVWLPQGHRVQPRVARIRLDYAQSGLNIPATSADRRFMKRLRHPTPHILEQFVLGRLGPPADPLVAQVEEHLLVCPDCVNIAEHTVEFAQVIRHAMSTDQAPGWYPDAGLKRR